MKALTGYCGLQGGHRRFYQVKLNVTCGGKANVYFHFNMLSISSVILYQTSILII